MLKWGSQTTNFQGVVIASDAKQEWMLPWWWKNYSRYNTYCVTFIDLGLSEEAREFCKEKGQLIEIPPIPLVGTKEVVSKETSKFWESLSDGRSWWEKRSLWHKKPIALLQTPYERTIWLDTDCEVKGSLEPLFQKITSTQNILICKDPEILQQEARKKGFILSDEILFNSGVIGFVKGSSHIFEWAKKTVEEHAFYFGDDTLLSRLIYENNWTVEPLDSLYNWRDLVQGPHLDAKISHWAGEAGKFFISLKGRPLC